MYCPSALWRPSATQIHALVFDSFLPYRSSNARVYVRVNCPVHGRPAVVNCSDRGVYSNCPVFVIAVTYTRLIVANRNFLVGQPGHVRQTGVCPRRSYIPEFTSRRSYSIHSRTPSQDLLLLPACRHTQRDGHFCKTHRCYQRDGLVQRVVSARGQGVTLCRLGAVNMAMVAPTR